MSAIKMNTNRRQLYWQVDVPLVTEMIKIPNRKISPYLVPYMTYAVYYIEINTRTFPYQPGYPPETPISARDAIEG